MRLRTAIEIGIEGEPERADALLELGSASHRAGKATDALEAFASAAEIARALDSAELLARAAIGYEDASWRPVVASTGLRSSCSKRRSRRSMTRASELRIGLLAGLARALDFEGERERGALVRENAVALARRHEDRAGLAKVLVRSYWARGTTPLEEILSMLTEARDLAQELGDAETNTEAMAWRVPTFVALGDLESARAEVVVLREMAERTAQPFMNHVAEHYGSAIALCDGNLADAEAMAGRSHDWGRLLTGRDASGTHGIQMFGVRREQGRLAELAPVVRILAGEGDREGPWRPGLVAVLAELGMEREARRELSRLAAEGIDGFQASLWLASLTYLTDACAALGDEAMAAIVYPELEPLAGTNSDDRSPGRLLRSRRPLSGHARRDAGGAGRSRGALRAGDGAEQADGSVDLAGSHGLRVRALPARTGAAGRDRAQALLGEAAAPGRADRHGGTARKDPLARRARLGGRSPRRALPARGADPGAGRHGAQQPRDRRGADDQRAHRGQPHPQHPAQDRLREPHRGRVLRPPARARLGMSGNPRYDQPMALYVIERSFADQLDLTDDDVELIEEINSDEGVRWLFSFLSADRRRTYCLYEAPSPDAILAAARKANVPADVDRRGGARPHRSSRTACATGPTPSTELPGHGTSPERERKRSKCVLLIR